MKIFKFELWKMFTSKFFWSLFLITIIIFSIFYIKNSIIISKDYVVDQKEHANLMINSIDDAIKQNFRVSLIEERKYYSEIIDAKNWKEIHLLLNQIDLLLLENPDAVSPHHNDLDYDYDTNIKLRKYNLNNNISPDDNTSGTILYNFFFRIYDFLCPLFIFMICIVSAISEYENGSIKYLLSMSYSYIDIVLSKWFSMIITSFALIFVPLIIFAIILVFLNGFSNEAMLFNVSSVFGCNVINNSSFLTVNNYFIKLFIIIVLCILMICTLTNCIIIIFKGKTLALFVSGALILLGAYNGFIFFIGRTLLGSIDLIRLSIITFFVMLVCYMISVYFLKKKDIF